MRIIVSAVYRGQLGYNLLNDYRLWLFQQIMYGLYFKNELPRVIALAISRGFKGVLTDSWGFTTPISGIARITCVSVQCGF